MSSGISIDSPSIPSSLTEYYFIALFSHYSINLHPIFTLEYFILHSPTSILTSARWNLRPARQGITIPRGIMKHMVREYMDWHWCRQQTFRTDETASHSIQTPGIMLATANVAVEHLENQDVDNTNCEISNDEIQDLWESLLWSHTEEDSFDHQ